MYIPFPPGRFRLFLRVQMQFSRKFLSYLVAPPSGARPSHLVREERQPAPASCRLPYRAPLRPPRLRAREKCEFRTHLRLRCLPCLPLFGSDGLRALLENFPDLIERYEETREKTPPKIDFSAGNPTDSGCPTFPKTLHCMPSFSFRYEGSFSPQGTHCPSW